MLRAVIKSKHTPVTHIVMGPVSTEEVALILLAQRGKRTGKPHHSALRHFVNSSHAQLSSGRHPSIAGADRDRRLPTRQSEPPRRRGRSRSSTGGTPDALQLDCGPASQAWPYRGAVPTALTGPFRQPFLASRCWRPVPVAETAPESPMSPQAEISPFDTKPYYALCSFLSKDNAK